MDFMTIGLLLISIIGWGIWAILMKVGVSKIGVEASLLINYSMEFLVVVSYVLSIQKLQIPRTGSVIYVILGGISVAIGSIAFFNALEKAPVSLARPMAGLNILIPLLLGFLLLNEVLTVKQYVGVGLAIAAIILMSS